MNTTLKSKAAAAATILAQIQQLLSITTISQGADTRQLEQDLEDCADALERVLFTIQNRGYRK